jgi:phospholipase/carboxylesterase
MREQDEQWVARLGRIAARPVGFAGTGEAHAPGLHSLELAPTRDALLYVPRSYRPDTPAPLAVMLHGAGGEARQGIELLQAYAEKHSLLMLATASRHDTWDRLGGGYGPDIAMLDRALATTFARYRVDPAHLAIGGFSDGASYALSVGQVNGQLFSHILAFSPGFVAPGGLAGQPNIFISHGTRDQVLPIDFCSRRIVPDLRRAGYAVRYLEFDGPHTVPPEVRQECLDWFVGQSPESRG